MPFNLTYETGNATTIQFLAVNIINLISSGYDTVQKCTTPGNGSCIGSMIPNLFLFIALAIFFGVIWLIGFIVQDRRSTKIAILLILAELLVLLIGLFDLIHNKTGFLGILLSISEIATAIWIIYLASRLIRARGGRVRSRRIRHHHSS